jgi:multicomponent Na+:H+ antiporter subunit G
MNPILVLSYIFILLGLILWFWGTIPILNKSYSLFYKLHTLTVSDTVGSILIIIGLLIRDISHWAVLTIATISLILWNTFFSYLLAKVTDK